MRLSIKDFHTFEMAKIQKSSRLEEYENKQIDQMLNNAILYQKMKLQKEINNLEKEKNSADVNISEIDAKILSLQNKIKIIDEAS